MKKIELNYLLTRKELKEGASISSRALQVPDRYARFARFGLHLVIGALFVAAAISFSFIADHPNPNPEMLSLFVGYLACMLVWRWSWNKGMSKSSSEFVEFLEFAGSTQLILDQNGAALSNNLGAAKIPWAAIKCVLTANTVTVLRYGGQILVIPHRALPEGVGALSFDKQLDEWKAQ